mgnify:FL=1
MDKIISLIERLERVKLARDMEPDPDGLSLSLWAMGAELAQLDELEKAALLAEFNQAAPLEGTDSLDLDMEALEQFIADYGE